MQCIAYLSNENKGLFRFTYKGFFVTQGKDNTKLMASRSVLNHFFSDTHRVCPEESLLSF